MVGNSCWKTVNGALLSQNHCLLSNSFHQGPTISAVYPNRWFAEHDLVMPAPNEETRWNHQLPVQGARKKHDARKPEPKVSTESSAHSNASLGCDRQRCEKKELESQPLQGEQKGKKRKKNPKAFSCLGPSYAQNHKTPINVYRSPADARGHRRPRGKIPN